MATLPDTTDNNKKAVLAALTDSRGIVSTACENANVGRSTFYEWMNDDPEFKAAVEAVNEEAIDFVESKLFERINGVSMADKDGNIYSTPPSDTAIIFYLKTKAKKRGYIERTELTGADGKEFIPPVVNINVVKPDTDKPHLETKSL